MIYFHGRSKKTYLVLLFLDGKDMYSNPKQMPKGMSRMVQKRCFLNVFLGVQVFDLLGGAIMEAWPIFPQISYPSKLHPAQSLPREGRFLFCQGFKMLSTLNHVKPPQSLRYPLVMSKQLLKPWPQKQLIYAIKNGGSFHSYVNVYQRVMLYTVFRFPGPFRGLTSLDSAWSKLAVKLTWRTT